VELIRRSPLGGEEAEPGSSEEAFRKILVEARGGSPLPELPERLGPSLVAPRRFEHPVFWGAAAAALLVAVSLPLLHDRLAPEPASGPAETLDAGRATPSPTLAEALPEPDARVVSSPPSDSKLAVTRVAAAPRAARPVPPPVRSKSVASQSVEFRLEKTADRVRLRWESGSGGHFRISRCLLRSEGPVCGRWVTVSGSEWVDDAAGEDAVVVYKVERIG
jgi:hypothetical protein